MNPKIFKCSDPNACENAHPGVKKLLGDFDEQKSAEWEQKRAKIVTASIVATALNSGWSIPGSQYTLPFLQSETLMMEKAGMCKGFEGNEATLHGEKLEPVARDNYVKRSGENLILFGLVIHPTFSFLGASPDGIGQKSARLLEIKCPRSRTVKEGNAVPGHYWIQCQIQMEVCDLEECDYFEFREMKRPPCVRTNLKRIKRDRKWFASVVVLLHGFHQHMEELQRIEKVFS